MATWTYAYLFPNANGNLSAKESFVEFTALGMNIDQEYVELVADTDGHCIEGDIKKITTAHAEDQIQYLLEKEIPIQVMFRNKEIYFSYVFANFSLSHYINFGWPKRLFSLFSKSKKDTYLRAMRNSAKKGGAIYVVFLEDAPDFFEDHFIYIDNTPYIDLQLPSGRLLSIEMIWVDRSKGGILPQGLKFTKITDIGEGFFEYHL